MAKTLYEKLFDAHVVYEAENETPLLYIDRHLVHEVTSPQAFDGLGRDVVIHGSEGFARLTYRATVGAHPDAGTDQKLQRIWRRTV